MDFEIGSLVKSPLNYTGGKYKLLPQILPYMPNDIDNFIDMFCGGCNVGVNVQANSIVCNDIQKVVIELMNEWKQITSTEALDILKDTISTYGLSKTNEEGFKHIREDYNNGIQSWDMFYAMVTNAFNYQIRFSKAGKYNMPFGRDRSSFNPKLEQTFIKYIDKLNTLNINFTNQDFKDVNLDNLGSEDLVYCDPPYLITLASYNEKDGWNETRERELLDLLDRVNEKGIRFALSNVLENKGKSNDILKEWCIKYNTHHLEHTYGNCNYHTKDKSNSSTDEVLITNY